MTRVSPSPCWAVLIVLGILSLVHVVAVGVF